MNKIKKELQILKDVVDKTADAVMITDHEGVIGFVNCAFERISGYSREELLGKNSRILKSGEHPQAFYQDLWETLERGKTYSGALINRNKQGELFCVQTTISPITEKRGKITHYIACWQDVTERGMVQKASQDLDEKWDSLITHSPDLIVIVDKECLILFINQPLVLADLEEERVLGTCIYEYLLQENNELLRGVMAHVFETSQRHEMELRESHFKKKDFWYLCRVSAVSQENQVIAVTLVFTDITQLKQSEAKLRKSQHRYRVLLETVTDYVYTVHVNNGEIVSVSHRTGCFAVTGYPKEAFEKKPKLWSQIVYKEDRKRLRSHESKLLQGNDAVALEHRITHKDGSLRWVRNTPVLERDDSGQLISYDAIISDITERKRAEEATITALKEKETLLQEIHHRVKNNLAIVSGFLGLQASMTNNKEVLELFNQAQDRVYTMALIYDKLYHSENLSKINLQDFLETLTERLLSEYSTGYHRIEVESRCCEGWIDLDQAIPCGLIVNELVTNALKHAFEPNNKGVIQVHLKSVDETHCSLQVHDNGKGFPENIDTKKPKTLGLRIVNGLTAQLRGTITIEPAQGTTIDISFPLKRKT
ncbi:PAS domain S-box protein [Deltaproteobacteria bacterium TL4]